MTWIAHVEDDEIGKDRIFLSIQHLSGYDSFSDKDRLIILANGHRLIPRSLGSETSGIYETHHYMILYDQLHAFYGFITAKTIEARLGDYEFEFRKESVNDMIEFTESLAVHPLPGVLKDTLSR